jgi:hypothetical protein
LFWGLCASYPQDNASPKYDIKTVLEGVKGAETVKITEKGRMCKVRLMMKKYYFPISYEVAVYVNE